MTDMYNKDYANDILRKLKQKIISENPDAIDALDAFADEEPAAAGETVIEEIDFFEAEEREEQEEQDPPPVTEEEETTAPIDVFSSQENPDEEEIEASFEEVKEDAFDLLQDFDGFQDMEESEEREQDAFGEVEEPEEEQEEEFWEAEREEDIEEEEWEDEDDIAPWDVLPEREESFSSAPSDEIADDLVEDVTEEIPAVSVEDIPSDGEENAEEVIETEVISFEEIPQDPQKEQEPAFDDDNFSPIVFSKKQRKLVDDPEGAVVVQTGEEQTDMLKRPLPRGQKIARSFFVNKEDSPEKGDENRGNIAITAWRSLSHHTRWTFGLMVIMAAFTLFIGLLECIPALRGLIFPFEVEENINRGAMLLDGGCLAVCLLLYLPAIIQSVKRLRDGIFDGEFCTAALALFAMVYQVLCGALHREWFFICFPFAFLLTLSQLGRFFMALAVQNNAEICLNSHLGTTAVLRRASDMPEVKAALADSEFTHHMVMSTAKFTDTNAFLTRLEKEHISSRYNWISMAGGILMGVIAMIFAYVYGSSHAIGSGLAVLCATFPLSIYLVHHWSFYRLSRELKNANMTVAGESAVYEVANADVVCLRDADAFPSSHVKLGQIKLCEDKRLDLLFVRLRALFATLGGPLNGIFSVSGDEVDRPISVNVTEITDDGITAIVDGETLSVGKGSYMAQKGIAFMYDADDETVIRNLDSPIMFVATGGVSSAKLYLRYKISEAFESYVRRLNRAGIGMIVRTCDPFITAEMIDRLSCLEKGSVGVVRSTAGGKIATDALTGAVVGYGTKPQTIYQTRFLFSAYRRMQQSLPWLSLVSIPLFGVLCALSVAAGAVTLPLMVVLYQIIGAIPALCIIEAVLRKYTMGDKRNNDK